MTLHERNLFTQKELMSLGEMTRGQVDFLKNNHIIKPFKPNSNKFTYYDALKVILLKELKLKFPHRKALNIIYNFSMYADEDYKMYELLTSSDHVIFGDVNNSLMMVEDVSDCSLIDEHTDCIFPVFDIPVPIEKSEKLNYSDTIYLKNAHVINLRSVKKKLDQYGAKHLVNFKDKKMLINQALPQNTLLCRDA